MKQLINFLLLIAIISFFTKCYISQKHEDSIGGQLCKKISSSDSCTIECNIIQFNGNIIEATTDKGHYCRKVKRYESTLDRIDIWTEDKEYWILYIHDSELICAQYISNTNVIIKWIKSDSTKLKST